MMMMNRKIRSDRETKMFTVTINSKTNKVTFFSSSPEPLDIIGYKFAWNISGSLVFKSVKTNKRAMMP